MYIKNSRSKPDFLHYNHNPKPSHCCFFHQGADYWLQAAPGKIANQQKIEWFFVIFRHFPGARSSARKCPSDLLGVMRFSEFSTSNSLASLCNGLLHKFRHASLPVFLSEILLRKKEGARLRPPCLCGAFDRPLSGTVKPISPTYGTSTAECLLRRRSYEV